mmetsp:Transcript_5212/g.19462  ORF Transcript_5212/g.19462 Transcript_5212/m.19462 type:complete len:299 (+) Transcript_5212:3867-4763(+)
MCWPSWASPMIKCWTPPNAGSMKTTARPFDWARSASPAWRPRTAVTPASSTRRRWQMASPRRRMKSLRHAHRPMPSHSAGAAAADPEQPAIRRRADGPAWRRGACEPHGRLAAGPGRTAGCGGRCDPRPPARRRSGAAAGPEAERQRRGRDGIDRGHDLAVTAAVPAGVCPCAAARRHAVAPGARTPGHGGPVRQPGAQPAGLRRHVCGHPSLDAGRGPCRSSAGGGAQPDGGGGAAARRACDGQDPARKRVPQGRRHAASRSDPAGDPACAGQVGVASARVIAGAVRRAAASWPAAR